uniref:Peptidase C1A papain C-terminal domain-containing protein n=1 Tax=Lactuca sativa TaxID=4236 RepID=A0A9R1XWT1_LACSA|nr:hypothetical protein LSAT_V11C100009380 [Lactuca sativa]
MKNPVFHGRSKHIDTKFQFIRECVENGEVKVTHVCSKEQRADILTKVMGKLKHKEMRELIGVKPKVLSPLSKIKEVAVRADYAFSAIAVVEGINQIVTGDLITLSEQQIIDCDTGKSNLGCNGGFYTNAFTYIIKNGGIDTEEDYPYTDEQYRECKLCRCLMNNETELQKAVANQPIVVALKLKMDDFQLYTAGVYNGECGSELNLSLVLVGYGTQTEDTCSVSLSPSSYGSSSVSCRLLEMMPTFDSVTSLGNIHVSLDAGLIAMDKDDYSGGRLLKDYSDLSLAWGSTWGDEGYIRLKRNVNEITGKCGIAELASYPIKTSHNPSNPTDKILFRLLDTWSP